MRTYLKTEVVSRNKHETKTKIFLDNNQNNFSTNLNKTNTKQKANQFPCRICFNDEYDQSNPLINPCKCRGSMKYIHLECLRIWLKSKIESRFSSKIMIFKLSSIECELCKSHIPGINYLKADLILFNNELYDILELEKPHNTNYIILENIIKDKQEKRFIYIIQMREKKTLYIVRSY